MGERDLVVIATSTHDYEMQILKTFIEDHGIRVFLRDENMTRGYYGVAVGGVKLEVMRKDVEVAVKLLHLYRQQVAQDEAKRGRLSSMPEAMHELMMVPRADEARRAGEARADLMQASLSATRCPHCGHPGPMEDVPWTGLQIAGIFLLLGFPLFFIKPQVKCPGCEATWRR